jgi:hypothetical protein
MVRDEATRRAMIAAREEFLKDAKKRRHSEQPKLETEKPLRSPNIANEQRARLTRWLAMRAIGCSVWLRRSVVLLFKQNRASLKTKPLVECKRTLIAVCNRHDLRRSSYTVEPC